MSGGNENPGFDDLRDPALRRALDHAPDSEATPHPRTRDAILKMAHNLATAPVSAGPAANNASAAPWWRRLFGGGEPHARMPWNAAFATVLVAAFVTVLWHKEPVPDARLDGEARVGEATAPAQAPAALPAPVQPSAEAAAPQAETQAAPAAVAPAPARAPAPEAEQRARIARDSVDSSAKRSAKEAANTAGADAARKAEPAPSLEQAAPAAPVAPAPAAAPAPVEPPAPSASIAPVPPPPVVAEQAAPAPALPPAPIARDERREAPAEAEQRRRAYAAGAPAAAAPAAVAPAPGAAPPYRESLQDSAPALASQDNASAGASGAVRPSAPAAAKAMAPRSVAPFPVLDRWTSFSFTRNGESVRHERGDIEGLPALVGTVARSATSPDEPLAAPVEARLELYRGKSLVAVLEIAGNQVRWTPQPGGAALVGTPPAQALDALRSLLSTR